MQRQAFIKLSCVLAMALGWFVPVYGGLAQDAQHTEVSMRMIGHEVLLLGRDTLSRVLPVRKENNVFVITFEKDFGIEPERMAAAIDSVIEVTGISEAYIVEVKTCEKEEIVYSYEMGGTVNPDIVPCRSRPLPVACYSLWITLTDMPPADHAGTEMAATRSEGEKTVLLWLLPLAILSVLLFYLFRGRRKKEIPDNHIAIGEYRFDPKAMTLAFQSERIELTGKESELLYLLYLSANSTVERELILEKVWGDQGDYVGRTLDVFISKLRKKLEADSAVQIKNIRGVGYKLVLSAA